MFCTKCENELSECTCEDLQERLERLKNAPHLLIGKDYQEKLDKAAKVNKDQKSVAE